VQINTLKKNKEFHLTYSRGKSYPSRNVVLICLKRKYGQVRFGFSVSKKIGGAVVRNRVRRRLKEAAGIFMKQEISGSYYLIFIARKGIENAKFSELVSEMNTVLKRAGIQRQESKE